VCHSVLLINHTIDIIAVPTFGDQEKLSQVTAFVLESLRWRPVSIGGVFALLKIVYVSNACPTRIRASCNDGCHMEELPDSQRCNSYRKPLVRPKGCRSG